MGGANAGEVASQIVLERVCERLYMLEEGLDEQNLKAAINSICIEIHKSIIHEGNNDSTKAGMGSTLIALLYYERKLYTIHAGDSRLYRFRNETLAQITQDHSLRELMSNSGAPSNVIFNSFGGGTSFFVDIEPAGKKVLDGDIFLLCSDGVTDMLSDEEIEEILCKEGFEDNILEQCKAKGGQDNISYVLVECSNL
jgi:protein phosphatase